MEIVDVIFTCPVCGSQAYRYLPAIPGGRVCCGQKPGGGALCTFRWMEEDDHRHFRVLLRAESNSQLQLLIDARMQEQPVDLVRSRA